MDGPRAVLSLFGLDESHWQRLIDKEPLDADEMTTVTRLLDRFADFPAAKMYLWQRHVDWRQVAEQPDQYRVELLDVAGRVRRLEEIDVPAALTGRFRFQTFFRAEIALHEHAGTAVVFTQDVPRQLAALARDNALLDERVRCTALFLKLAAGGNERLWFTLVTPHLGWYPDTARPDAGIPEDYVALANLGWDPGTLDDVSDKTPLTAADREAFYQLLAAASRDQADVLLQIATAGGNVTDLLQNPAQHRGRLWTVRGNARRAVRITVDDPDIVTRFGIRHYYEVVVFLDPNAIVRVTRDAQDREGKVFTSYPLVFCATQLPAGMPEGELINEFVEVTGAYLKLWSYRSEFLEAQYHSTSGRVPRQFSPLLIGRAPIRLEVTRPDNPRAQLLAGLAFIAAVGGVWLVVWWYGRGDERFKRDARARNLELPAGQSLDELIADVTPKLRDPNGGAQD